jgi:hypothetical protein
VDRLPILVSSEKVKQLLGVPKLPSGAGESMASAIFEVLQQWHLVERVKGTCFDTTPSNIGVRNGACVLTERNLEKDLLYFACRHHVFELILEAVFMTSLTPSPSPDILIFKCFKTKWHAINYLEYRTALSDAVTALAMENFPEDIIEFAQMQLRNIQRHDDYRELLEITIIFLGGTPLCGAFIMAPGGLHKARWMAKAI